MSSPKVQTNAVVLPEKDEGIRSNECYDKVTHNRSEPRKRISAFDGTAKYLWNLYYKMPFVAPRPPKLDIGTSPTDEQIKEWVVFTMSTNPFPCLSTATLDSLLSLAEVELGLNLCHKTELVKSSIESYWGLKPGIFPFPEPSTAPPEEQSPKPNYLFAALNLWR